MARELAKLIHLIASQNRFPSDPTSDMGMGSKTILWGRERPKNGKDRERASDIGNNCHTIFGVVDRSGIMLEEQELPNPAHRELWVSELEKFDLSELREIEEMVKEEISKKELGIQ